MAIPQGHKSGCKCFACKAHRKAEAHRNRLLEIATHHPGCDCDDCVTFSGSDAVRKSLGLPKRVPRGANLAQATAIVATHPHGCGCDDCIRFGCAPKKKKKPMVTGHGVDCQCRHCRAAIKRKDMVKSFAAVTKEASGPEERIMDLETELGQARARISEGERMFKRLDNFTAGERLKITDRLDKLEGRQTHGEAPTSDEKRTEVSAAISPEKSPQDASGSPSEYNRVARACQELREAYNHFMSHCGNPVGYAGKTTSPMQQRAIREAGKSLDCAMGLVQGVKKELDRAQKKADKRVKDFHTIQSGGYVEDNNPKLWGQSESEAFTSGKSYPIEGCNCWGCDLYRKRHPEKSPNNTPDRNEVVIKGLDLIDRGRRLVETAMMSSVVDGEDLWGEPKGGPCTGGHKNRVAVMGCGCDSCRLYRKAQPK